MEKSMLDILVELGYSPLDRGKEYRMRPIYRPSDNNTSLCVFKDNGFFVDYGAGNLTGSFTQLVKLSLGAEQTSQAQTFLRERGFTPESPIVSEGKVKMKTPRIYPENILLNLLPDYKFFLGRGISKETLKTFKVGLAHSGKMRLRLCAPIYDEHGRIYGFWGRWYNETPPNKDIPKYKIVGPKNLFVYPRHLAHDEIRLKREIILVEGPSDVLYCWENGIKNVICLLGTKLLSGVLKYLISVSPSKIIIATNNEPDNVDDKGRPIGNTAAVEIREKLLKFFDEKQVVIHLPPKKDLASLTPTELQEWQQKTP